MVRSQLSKIIYLRKFSLFNTIHAIRKCHIETNPTASLIQFLQNSLGFSSETALKLSEKLKGKIPKNPGSVCTSFKSYGLSETQIRSIVDRVPLILCYSSPESTLNPKINFLLKEKGIPESDLVNLLVSNPRLFIYSLDGTIKPLLDVLLSILGSDKAALQFLIRTRLVVSPHTLSANLNILRKCGLPHYIISNLFMKLPRGLVVKSDRLRKAVKIVRGMGFKTQSSLFGDAVATIAGSRPATWDAKFNVYKSLGWSTEEILLVFRRQPACLRLSEEKIRKNFDYLKKELGWNRSYILTHPSLLLYSVDERIVPRHKFLQFLASKGFFKKDEIVAGIFQKGENNFVKDFVKRYESKVPEIRKIYEDLLGPKLPNIKDGKDSKASKYQRWKRL